jgi:hypothetical protein
LVSYTYTLYFLKSRFDQTCAAATTQPNHQKVSSMDISDITSILKVFEQRVTRLESKVSSLEFEYAELKEQQNTAFVPNSKILDLIDMSMDDISQMTTEYNSEDVKTTFSKEAILGLKPAVPVGTQNKQHEVRVNTPMLLIAKKADMSLYTVRNRYSEVPGELKITKTTSVDNILSTATAAPRPRGRTVTVSLSPKSNGRTGKLHGASTPAKAPATATATATAATNQRKVTTDTTRIRSTSLGGAKTATMGDEDRTPALLKYSLETNGAKSSKERGRSAAALKNRDPNLGSVDSDITTISQFRKTQANTGASSADHCTVSEPQCKQEVRFGLVVQFPPNTTD